MNEVEATRLRAGLSQSRAECAYLAESNRRLREQLGQPSKHLSARTGMAGSPGVDHVPVESESVLRIEHELVQFLAGARNCLADGGRLTVVPVEDALAAPEKLRATDLPELRLSRENSSWLEECRRRASI